MSDFVHDGNLHRSQLAFLDRAAIAAALAFAIAVFLKLGWFSLQADDPLSPVTLLHRSGVALDFVQVAGLAAVVAAIVSLVAARRFPDIGPLCVAVGLAVVSLYGGTAEALLADNRNAGDGGLSRLAWRFLFESLVWFVPIALAIGSSALTVWTLSPQSVSDRSTAKSDLTRHGLLPSGLDVQFLRSSHAGVPVTRCTDFTDGLKHTLIAAVAGILAIAVLSTGSGFRAVRHGQVCFTLAAGMLIGCYTALSLAPVRSALWSVLATPLIAVLGYAWASFVGEPLANPFLRILPVQMISVGVAAAITTIWYHAAPDVEAMNDAAAGRGGGSVGSGL